MVWLIAPLVANTLAALVFLLCNRKNGQKMWLALYFFVVPLLGFIIYGVTLLALRKGDIGYDREYLVKRFNLERTHSRPEMQTELNVIPVEDAMAFGENAEKRRLLLNQLKKSVRGNYKHLLAASSDEDSESAHYIASAKMEVYHDLYENIKRATDALSKSPNDRDCIQALLSAYTVLIDSGILSGSEQDIYRDRFCALFLETSAVEWAEGSDVTPENAMALAHITSNICYLIDLKRYDKAEAAFYQLKPEQRTERAYFKLLEAYYAEGSRRERFYEVLDELCKSDITLSSEGIGLVRFWLSKK